VIFLELKMLITAPNTVR